MFIHPIKKYLTYTTLAFAGLGLAGCDYWPPALQHEIEQLRADLNDALDERQRLDNDNVELRAQHASLQQEVEEKLRENEELRSHLTTLTARQTQTLSSRQVTGPTKTAKPRQTLMKGTYQQLQLTRPRMKGPKVARLQRLLRQQGFSVRVDGVFGKTTATAIRRFQRQHGLRADGSVGPKTEKLLRLTSTKVDALGRKLQLQNPPLKGQDVKKVQRALRRAGQRVTIDGRFGPETDIAVTRFQQKHGLAPDGIVGPTTWVKLARSRR